MRKLIISTGILMAGFFAKAQDGMDYNGVPFNRWSGLQYPAATGVFGPLINNANSEKALGVYQIKTITPVSYLEVNTNSSNMPWPMPGLPLSEVFSTNSPIDGFWRLKVAGSQVGRVFSNANNFKADAPLGDLIFQTGSADRVWIKNASGWMGINTNGPTRFLDINGDLRIRTVTQNNLLNQVLVIDGSGNVFWRDASTIGSALTCSNVICNTSCAGLQPASNVFEVNNDINLTSPVLNHGYRIGCEVVLQDPGTNNIYVGQNAGRLSTAASVESAFLGSSAGLNNAAPHNTFVGYRAGFTNSTGNANTFLGHVAGYNNTNAVRGTFVGDSAGYSNTVGRWNTFTGYACGIANVNGEGNSFYGKHCALSHVSGNENSYYGNHGGANMIDGNANVMVGSNTAIYQQHGDSNSYVGNMSGPSINVYSTVNKNSFLGARSGFFNTVGDYNTYLGYKSGNTSGIFVNHSAAVGENALVRSDYKMILGDNKINVGIGLSDDNFLQGPQNKLEIDAGINGFQPTTPGNVGASGLRFRDLHSTTATVPNPGKGLLSVDNLGNVIYVPDSCCGSGASLGNPCGGAPNPLPAGGWEIPLGGNNFVFSGQGLPNNNVGIGTNCSPTAKLEVLQNSGSPSTTALLVTNNDNKGIGGDFKANGPYGVKALALQQGAGLTTTGVYGEARYNSTKANFGVEGFASESASGNYGGRFHAVSTVNNPAFNYGIETEAANANINYGAYIQGFSFNPSTTGNTGIYTTAFGNGGNVALQADVLGVGPNDLAGLFNGDVTINGVGTITSGGWVPSDVKFKKEIKDIEKPMEALMKLKPKSYLYDTQNAYKIKFYDKKQFGFIAQELEEVIPELVKETTKPAQRDKEGNITVEEVKFKTVNYDGLIAFLVKGMQEQQKQIETQDQKNNDLQKQIDELKKLMQSCCSTNSSQGNNDKIQSTDVNFSDKHFIVLNQNTPNPFAENTTISYYIPDNFTSAQVLFYDGGGKLIKTADIKTKGKGVLNVFASDLSSGVYSYTLVIDGTIIDTKRMVKQN